MRNTSTPQETPSEAHTPPPQSSSGFPNPVLNPHAFRRKSTNTLHKRAAMNASKDPRFAQEAERLVSEERMTDANMSVAREKSGGTVKNGGSTMLRTRSVGGCLHSMESGLRGWKRFESDVSATRSLKSLDSGFCLEEKSEAEKKENRKEGNVEAENARKESMKLFRRDSAIVSVDAVEEKG